jgi:hypothetical protein
MSLPTRKIGQHTVSALGYGAMSLGDAYGSAGSDEDRQKVHFLAHVVVQVAENSHHRCWMRFIRPGSRSGTPLICTGSRSPLSASGAPCRLFLHSSILKVECRFARTGKRSDIFLATKFGFVMAVDRTKPDISINGTPEWMHQQFNASLKALQTDYVDMYYLHRPDTNTPIEITVGAMAELVK